MLKKKLADGKNPRRSYIVKRMVRLFEQGAARPRFELRGSETQKNEFANFGHRKNGISKKTNLSDAYFCAQIKKSHASHGDRAMSDCCMEFT
jgi:hypothetical protein